MNMITAAIVTVMMIIAVSHVNVRLILHDDHTDNHDNNGDH